MLNGDNPQEEATEFFGLKCWTLYTQVCKIYTRCFNKFLLVLLILVISVWKLSQCSTGWQAKGGRLSFGS